MNSDTQERKMPQGSPAPQALQGPAQGSQGSQAAPEQWKIFRKKNVDRFKDPNKLETKTTNLQGLTGESFVEAVNGLLTQFNGNPSSSDNKQLINFKIDGITCDNVIVFNDKFEKWSDALKTFYAYYYIQLLTQLITDCKFKDGVDVEKFNDHINGILIDNIITEDIGVLDSSDVIKAVNLRLSDLNDIKLLKIPKESDINVNKEDVKNISKAFNDMVVGAVLIKSLYENKDKPNAAPAAQAAQQSAAPAAQRSAAPVTQAAQAAQRSAAQAAQSGAPAAQQSGPPGSPAPQAPQSGPPGPPGNVSRSNTQQHNPNTNPTQHPKTTPQTK